MRSRPLHRRILRELCMQSFRRRVPQTGCRGRSCRGWKSQIRHSANFHFENAQGAHAASLGGCKEWLLCDGRPFHEGSRWEQRSRSAHLGKLSRQARFSLASCMGGKPLFWEHQTPNRILGIICAKISAWMPAKLNSLHKHRRHLNLQKSCTALVFKMVLDGWFVGFVSCTSVVSFSPDRVELQSWLPGSDPKTRNGKKMEFGPTGETVVLENGPAEKMMKMAVTQAKSTVLTTARKSLIWTRFRLRFGLFGPQGREATGTHFQISFGFRPKGPVKGLNSACAPLCCKNLCRASRFCTGGRGAAGSRSKHMSKGPWSKMLAQGNNPRLRDWKPGWSSTQDQNNRTVSTC